MFLRKYGCVCLALFAALPIAVGDEPPRPDPNQPTQVQLTITPAQEPRPAFKYSLAIGTRERKPGNAATFYYRALLQRRHIPAAHFDKYSASEQAWLEEPVNVKTLTEMKEWLAPFQGSLAQLKVAVYRDHCDWDYHLEELKGLEVVSFLLPEIQDCRDLARTLRVKARVEIAERRYDDAIETLRWGYQLAQDCGNQPLLISNLVGIAISATMNEQLVELMQAPGAPNLYWAIAALPQPLVDVRKAIEFERGFPEQIFPFLKDAETVERSPQEWQRVLTESMKDISQLTNDIQVAGAHTPDWVNKAGLMLMLAKAYPAAKEELIASGLSRDKVEAMSVAQVIAIQTARHTREAYDDVFKAMVLPYPESLKVSLQMDEVNKKRLAPGVFFGTQGLPIAQIIMPATMQVKRAELRGPRQFAVLQVIEAIRLHAAATGHLPKTLQEITVVPVPQNPIDRQPFPYTVLENQAILEMPILADEGPRSVAKRYAITLRR